jgi:hypothetical protein
VAKEVEKKETVNPNQSALEHAGKTLIEHLKTFGIDYILSGSGLSAIVSGNSDLKHTRRLLRLRCSASESETKSKSKAKA